MTIVLATTTIAVKRPARPSTEDPYGDGYDDPADRDDSVTDVASGVRATIAPGSTSGASSGGESQVTELRLTCDPCDLTYLDTVVDETTGEEYEVQWSLNTGGVAGLGHIIAGLRATKGRSGS